jgi:hypothetical protein
MTSNTTINKKAAFATGVVLALSFNTPILRSQETVDRNSEVYNIVTRNHTVLQDQLNHPWVGFTYKEKNYLAIEYPSERLNIAGVTIYKVNKDNSVSKLTDDEKNQLVSNPAVKYIIIKKIDEMRHRPALPTRLGRN